MERGLISISTISEILSSPPNNFSTTLSGNVSSSGLTLPLNDVTGLGTEGVGVIYQKDSDGNPVTSTIEFVHWTGVSSLNLTLTDTGDRGISGSASSAQAHNSGDTFEVWTHSAYYPLNAVTLSATQTLTNKTLTQPKIGTSIDDTNGNELVKVTATASAVNELTLANAATGASPVLSATGGDDNVGIDIKAKGTGVLRKPTIIGIQVLDSGTSTAVADGKAYFRVPAELNGMNLTGVAATVYTAGTTNVTTFQIRNKTDSVDCLSTALTIDSGETDTSTAATPAVIDTTKDDVATGDVLAIDCDAVSTTPAKGAYIEMRFELP